MCLVACTCRARNRHFSWGIKQSGSRAGHSTDSQSKIDTLEVWSLSLGWINKRRNDDVTFQCFWVMQPSMTSKSKQPLCVQIVDETHSLQLAVVRVHTAWIHIIPIPIRYNLPWLSQRRLPIRIFFTGRAINPSWYASLIRWRLGRDDSQECNLLPRLFDESYNFIGRSFVRMLSETLA